MTRAWEEGDARGTKDTIPFLDHRTLAEAWAADFAYARRLAAHRKPRKDDEGDAA